MTSLVMSWTWLYAFITCHLAGNLLLFSKIGTPSYYMLYMVKNNAFRHTKSYSCKNLLNQSYQSFQVQVSRNWLLLYTPTVTD